MTKTTNNQNNATINASALMDCIISNKGFASRRINAEQLNVESLNEWHALLDTLLKSAYKVISDAHNGKNADYSPIYADIKTIFDLFGKLENGGKLRADSDTALSIVAFASKQANKYSTDYAYKCSQIRCEKMLLAERTTDTGKPKKGMEESVKTINARIEELEREKEELKAISGSVEKHTTRQSKTAFYKKVEDFIAEKCLDILVKTNEEIEVEEEARKKARNKKNNERKQAQKKAQNK